MMVPHDKKILELAQDLFNAYNSAEPNPWKTFDGRPVPTWTQLNDQVQAKWYAVALAATKRAVLP